MMNFQRRLATGSLIVEYSAGLKYDNQGSLTFTLVASRTHSPYPSQEGKCLRRPRDVRLLIASSDNTQSVQALRTSPLEGS